MQSPLPFLRPAASAKGLRSVLLLCCASETAACPFKTSAAASSGSSFHAVPPPVSPSSSLSSCPCIPSKGLRSVLLLSCPAETAARPSTFAAASSGSSFHAVYPLAAVSEQLRCELRYVSCRHAPGNAANRCFPFPCTSPALVLLSRPTVLCAGPARRCLMLHLDLHVVFFGSTLTSDIFSWGVIISLVILGISISLFDACCKKRGRRHQGASPFYIVLYGLIRIPTPKISED